MKQMKFDELAAFYCARQQQTPHGLRLTLEAQRDRYAPDGWMLLECVVMDSSWLGSLTILPYGPNNTHKQRLAEGVPISPRGLASDMSVCVGWGDAEFSRKPWHPVGKLRWQHAGKAKRHVARVSRRKIRVMLATHDPDGCANFKQTWGITLWDIY